MLKVIVIVCFRWSACQFVDRVWNLISLSSNFFGKVCGSEKVCRIWTSPSCSGTFCECNTVSALKEKLSKRHYMYISSLLARSVMAVILPCLRVKPCGSFSPSGMWRRLTLPLQTSLFEAYWTLKARSHQRLGRSWPTPVSHWHFVPSVNEDDGKSSSS